MEGITIKDIVTITGGTLLCGDENKEIREFAIDSRQGNEDSIFVPIIGERVDAHRFIDGALAINGATFTQEHEEPLLGLAGKPWIRVEDTVKAMQQVGTFYRNKMELPVVAVTGSVGKTTTREMIAHALSADRQVFQTMGNQNSQIGVPLTLSHISREDEVAVLEIGMSERGQIEILTNMIRPDVAVVTMIGVSHIAQLGSQENICLEKMDIVKGLPADGMVFLNGDDPFLAAYRDKL
ncbi:MAG: UDP-N-acetylmuramoyl-tripeptide--D-alanyl-D-alanine ligase, partial [Eubacterium sp.]|nr:UDP-N-acetylmuramoyl-tripeptide--D-alanyl-D-alanine ligase [Eubacterium sp.]